jgi:cysteine desulfurase
VPVYLDHAATTPMLPEAAEAMIPWLTERFGNPSGAHAVARRARRAVDEARDTVCSLLGVPPGGLVWTGGGTEADNLAVRGALGALEERDGPRRAVVVSAVEHRAVRDAAARSGAPVRTVGVDGDGVVDLASLTEALDASVAVVSVMAVNNEVGVVQPLEEIAGLVAARAPGAVLHTDAVQALRWLDLRQAVAGADLISVSGHKFGGPQGVGALGVRPGTPLRRVTEGGGQERDLRPGTHNVAGIVATAVAAAATDAARAGYLDAVRSRRDRLVGAVLDALPGSVLLGARADRVAGIATLCFEEVESEALLVLLDGAGVAASAGSACASGALQTSHVLAAMGVPERLAVGALRVSLAPSTTDDEVDEATEAIVDAVQRLRKA